jgi:hypothetical protein
MHYSIDTEDIKTEIEKLGHLVTNILWEPPTRQFYPYFPAFEPPAAYSITVGQTSANLHWLALGYTAGR